jgi:HEAT repeat protein
MLTFEERERESVLRDLCSADEEVRRLAVERAFGLAPDEVVPRLVERLGDPSWRVRKAAVERLGAWPDGDAIARALIEALSDGDNPGRRNAAVDALVKSGPAAVPRLLESVCTGDVDVRKFVVDVLAGIGDARALPALVERLADEDANVRAAAADALGAIGGSQAVSALRGTAVDTAQPDLVRYSALCALSALGVAVPASELTGALASAMLRPAALDVLGGADDDREARGVLLKALEDPGRASREAAMRALLSLLSRVGDEECEEIAGQIREVGRGAPAILTSAIERLSEADLATRLVLVQFLGLLGAPEAPVPLLLAGGDEALAQVVLSSLELMGEVAEQSISEVWRDLDPDARRDACVFFGRSAGPRSADCLVAAVDDPDPSVRTAAARSIGARGLGEGLAPLVRRLADPGDEGDDPEAEEERAAVADALVRLAGPEGGVRPDRAIELLSAALDGAAEPVRVAIARVLGCLGRPRDRQIVGLLLKDASAQVRRAAVAAIARLTPDAATEPLHLAIADESAEVRMAVARALGERVGAEVIGDLRRLAEDPDPQVRSAAVRAVGMRIAQGAGAGDDADACEILDAACDDAAPVALAAVEAVRAIGSGALARVVRLLQREEPDVVREAVRCIGEHGGSDDLDRVIPLAAHPDWSVRAESIQVLSNRGVERALPAILRRLDLEQDEYVRSVTLRALERLEG